MALFLVVATPLFSFGAILYLAERSVEPAWPQLIRSAGLAMVLSFPAYAGIAAIGSQFADSYRDLPLYIRSLLGEHLLPTACAVGTAVLLHAWRRARSRHSSWGAPGVASTSLVATLGGFLAVFAILERLERVSDPSAYWLLLLPLLRLGTIGSLVALVRAAERWNGWTRAGIIALAASVPMVGATAAIFTNMQQHLVAASVAAVMFLGGVVGIYLARQAETRHA
jgi:hypothetical protein